MPRNPPNRDRKRAIPSLDSPSGFVLSPEWDALTRGRPSRDKVSRLHGSWRYEAPRTQSALMAPHKHSSSANRFVFRLPSTVLSIFQYRMSLCRRTCAPPLHFDRKTALSALNIKALFASSSLRLCCFAPCAPSTNQLPVFNNQLTCLRTCRQSYKFINICTWTSRSVLQQDSVAIDYQPEIIRLPIASTIQHGLSDLRYSAMPSV